MGCSAVCPSTLSGSQKLSAHSPTFPPPLPTYPDSLCPVFSDRMASLEHGIVFLGTDQIRTLILSCCMAMDIGSCYSSEQLRSFWQHSVLTACLSERIARYVDYTGVENAYRAGLFHDAGALALVRWAVRTRGIKTVDNTLCGETIDAERERLGIDHGFVGKLLGHAWKLPGEISRCAGMPSPSPGV